MKADHIHIRVADINEIVHWFETFLELRPNYRDNTMAMYPFGEMAILFDKSDRAMPVTIGFSSDDCDADFRRLVELGAVALNEPADQAYGVRSAYLKGPGDLTIEIEQTLPRAA
jgi:catechol 2,3-dioxygenase-like lactoylglutathione lyase family enzyme